MTIANNFRTLLIIGALLGSLSACEKQGAMEKAGESMDEALEKSSDKLKEIGDDIEEAVTDDAR